MEELGEAEVELVEKRGDVEPRLVFELLEREKELEVELEVELEELELEMSGERRTVSGAIFRAP